jgi:hypothetical protein
VCDDVGFLEGRVILEGVTSGGTPVVPLNRVLEIGIGVLGGVHGTGPGGQGVRWNGCLPVTCEAAATDKETGDEVEVRRSVPAAPAFGVVGLEFGVKFSTGVGTGLGGHDGAQDIAAGLGKCRVLGHIIDHSSSETVHSSETRQGEDVDVCEDLVDEFIRQHSEVSEILAHRKCSSAVVQSQASSQALDIKREQSDGIVSVHRDKRETKVGG